jgi:hypothetical protein
MFLERFQLLGIRWVSGALHYLSRIVLVSKVEKARILTLAMVQALRMILSSRIQLLGLRVVRAVP